MWAASVICFAQALTLSTALNEQIIMLRVGEGWGSTELETTIFKPNGDGPFPLVVINHGKANGDPRFQERARYLVAANALVERGYIVVVPMRLGFSKSGGAYINPGCNITSNGLVQAEGIREVLAVLVKRPDVDAQRIVVMGQSHGGLTTMALGTMNFPGVRGLVNFAGGLRITGGSSYCGWEKSLGDASEAGGGFITMGIEHRGLWPPDGRSPHGGQARWRQKFHRAPGACPSRRLPAPRQSCARSGTWQPRSRAYSIN